MITQPAPQNENIPFANIDQIQDSRETSEEPTIPSSDSMINIQGLKEHPTVQFTPVRPNINIGARPGIGHVTSKTFTRWAPKPLYLKN